MFLNCVSKLRKQFIRCMKPGSGDFGTHSKSDGYMSYFVQNTVALVYPWGKSLSMFVGPGEKCLVRDNPGANCNPKAFATTLLHACSIA